MGQQQVGVEAKFHYLRELQCDLVNQQESKMIAQVLKRYCVIWAVGST